MTAHFGCDWQAGNNSVYEVKINLEYSVDDSLFGMPQAFQKCTKLTKHPNFRGKKIVEPGLRNKIFPGT